MSLFFLLKNTILNRQLQPSSLEWHNRIMAGGICRSVHCGDVHSFSRLSSWCVSSIRPKNVRDWPDQLLCKRLECGISKLLIVIRCNLVWTNWTLFVKSVLEVTKFPMPCAICCQIQWKTVVGLGQGVVDSHCDRLSALSQPQLLTQFPDGLAEVSSDLKAALFKKHRGNLFSTQYTCRGLSFICYLSPGEQSNSSWAFIALVVMNVLSPTRDWLSSLTDSRVQKRRMLRI